MNNINTKAIYETMNTGTTGLKKNWTRNGNSVMAGNPTNPVKGVSFMNTLEGVTAYGFFQNSYKSFTGEVLIYASTEVTEEDSLKSVIDRLAFGKTGSKHCKISRFYGKKSSGFLKNSYKLARNKNGGLADYSKKTRQEDFPPTLPIIGVGLVDLVRGMFSIEVF